MEHTVEDDSACPDVDPSVYFQVFVVGETLRGHVSQTAGVKILLGEKADGPRNAKIDDLNFFLLGVDEEDVLQFEVPVDEVVEVAVLHALDDLLEEGLGRCLVKLALLLNYLEELAPLKKLHDDGHLHVLEGEAVVHLDYVVVV